MTADIDIETGIDSDRIVEDLEVETYYAPLEELIEAEGFLRVIGDVNDFTNVEIRIPHAELEKLGWQKVESV